jgi:hypothetical protein
MVIRRTYKQIRFPGALECNVIHCIRRISRIRVRTKDLKKSLDFDPFVEITGWGSGEDFN